MEWVSEIPEWRVWCAAGAAGAIALYVIVNLLGAALDLDAG